MKTAYFIGGFMDLTKKQVDERQDEIYFAKPLNIRSFSVADRKQPINCEFEKVVYRLVGITQNNYLIYEVLDND